MSTDISPVNHLSGIPRQRIWLHSRLLCHVLSTWSWCKQAWLSSGHHFDKRLRSLLVTIWYLLEHVSKLKFCLHSRVLINHPLRPWSQVNCTTAKSLLPWRRRWQLISLITDTCNLLFRQKIYLWHLGMLFSGYHWSVQQKRLAPVCYATSIGGAYEGNTWWPLGQVSWQVPHPHSLFAQYIYNLPS